MKRRIARCVAAAAAAVGLAVGFTGQATAASSDIQLTYVGANMCVGGVSSAFSGGYFYSTTIGYDTGR